MPEPIITVRGEAQLQGPPDLATVGITVTASDSDAAPVRAELAAASGAIREILDARTDSLESWATTGFHVSPTFSRRGTTITGYQGELTTTVVLKDLQSIADLVSVVGDLAGSSISGPSWSLRPDNPLHREARVAAITDARRRAEDYAMAFDGTLGAVLEVSDVDGGYRGGPVFALMDKAGTAEEPLDLEPAVQTTYGQVTVRFRLIIGD